MYKILIVEDDEIIAGAIQKEIRSWGYDARQAEDFEHVLQAVSYTHLDVYKRQDEGRPLPDAKR